MSHLLGYIVELPTILADAVTLVTASTTPVLINRDPEPNETGVAAGTNISVDIVDIGSAGINLSTVQVYVEGTLAFNAGTFLAGFNGAGSTHSAPDAYTRRVIIDPTAGFTSSQVVDVRVVASTNSPVTSIDQTYSFTCADTVGPQVSASALATGQKTIRVTFNEAVRQTSASGSNDALNPTNYAIARTSSEAVYGGAIADLDVVSVTAVNSTAVELTTDIEHTPAGVYTLTVSNVADTSGNVISAPNNTASFLGYSPPRPANRKFDLYKMLSAQDQRDDQSKDLKKFVGVVQELMDLLLFLIDTFPEIKDPDFAPEIFVDALLEDLGNPFPFELALIDRRKLVREFVPLMKLKGTAPGLINAIRFFLGLEVAVVSYNEEGWRLGNDRLGSTATSSQGTCRLSGGISTRFLYEVKWGPGTAVPSADQKYKLLQISRIMQPVNCKLRRINTTLV
jgi:phage tail-like protein